MSVVEQYARVQVLTDADIPEEGDGRCVPAVLRYDPADDPRSVRIGLPGPRWFRFARELLERGLRAPAGTGEVRVWPCGRVRAVVEFHPERGGCSVVQFDTDDLLRFLRRTYAANPALAQPVPR
ncbi:SsgA family sporulation/cell division regulator [Streptomyces sp. NPDC090994]|uniref:SsgA family sporulation/cell division regulator n=1 Tax=Streptomyces sp. NPDC090994 TaxID=3365969 RepID=UPI003813751E